MTTFGGLFLTGIAAGIVGAGVASPEGAVGAALGFEVSFCQNKSSSGKSTPMSMSSSANGATADAFFPLDNA